MELNRILNPLSQNEMTLKNICYICNKKLINKEGFRRHIIFVHSVPKKCLFCDKKIKINGRNDLLKQHLTRCIPFLNHCERLNVIGKTGTLDIFYLKCFKNHNKK